MIIENPVLSELANIKELILLGGKNILQVPDKPYTEYQKHKPITSASLGATDAILHTSASKP